MPTSNENSSSTPGSNPPSVRGKRFRDHTELQIATGDACFLRFRDAFGFEWDPSLLDVAFPEGRPTDFEARELLNNFQLAFQEMKLFVERQARRRAERVGAAPLNHPDDGPTALFLPELVADFSSRFEGVVADIERRYAALRPVPNESGYLRVRLAQELVRMEVLERPGGASDTLPGHPFGRCPTELEIASISIILGSWPSIDAEELRTTGVTIAEAIAAEERAIRQAMRRARQR